MDVFDVEVNIVLRVDAIAESLPKGRSYMRDQLRRAANSVALNIPEGAGEFSPADKARFYRIAKRSATETAAQVIVASQLGLASPHDFDTATELLERVVSMLVRMAANAERRGR